MGLINTLFAPLRASLNLLFSSSARVEGDSMMPTLEDRQVVLVVRPMFPWNRLSRGDVVVLMPPAPPWEVAVKRVVGMPDESVILEEGRLYVDDLLLFADPLPTGPDGKRNGHWWNGPEDYFVLGDNYSKSTDSRTFGYVPSERIIGRVWLRVWPIGSLGPVL